MQNDETTDETQVVEQEGQTETVEETATEETSTEETPEAKLEKAQNEAAKYRRLYEKSQKKPEVKPKAPSPVSSQPNVEEAVLLAQGVDESLIEELKLRAPKYGGSLIKAQKDSNYLAVKEKLEKEQKQKNASLPASRGSGGAQVQKNISTPGLSRDEHKKMVQEITS